MIGWATRMDTLEELNRCFPGRLEQRQYNLACEVKDYLTEHPTAAVVNLGCGLDDTLTACLSTARRPLHLTGIQSAALMKMEINSSHMNTSMSETFLWLV